MRGIGFLLVLAVLTWGAVQLADNPGSVAITWQGYRMTSSVGVLLLIIAAIAILWAFLSNLWRWLRTGPGRFVAGREDRRRERGYRLLTEGLVAAAAGDAKAARESGAKAGRLVQTPLNLLLLAQAAQLNGDEAAAGRYFDAMLAYPETEFLGLRGLIVQAGKAGDREAALEYARRAHGLRPETEWLSSALFDLESRAGDWRAAQKTLEAGIKAKLIKPLEASRRRAVVFAERARIAQSRGDSEDALALARAAYKLAPGLVAATTLAAELLTSQGKTRQTVKLIEAAWKCGPHPDLARAYAAIVPDESALARTRRFERLHALNPDHPESCIALAEAALEADLRGVARHHLDAAVGEHPTRQVYRLLATLEERQGGNAEALRSWLLRAADAPPSAAWLCGKCGTTNDQWRARCTACDAFDSLSWKLPPTTVLRDSAAVKTQAPAIYPGLDSPSPVVDVALPQE